MAEYHEVRIVAELRKQGEHERAEEFRLKAMRRTPRRIPEHLVPLAGTPLGLPTPASCRPVRGRASTQAMTIDTEGLRELAAELGFWPATTDEADIEHHRPAHQERGLLAGPQS
jgi:hypothetical protein